MMMKKASLGAKCVDSNGAENSGARQMTLYRCCVAIKANVLDTREVDVCMCLVTNETFNFLESNEDIALY